MGGIEAAELQASFVKIPTVTRIRILFFYSSNVRYSPEEENRQLEKLCYQVGLVHSPNATVNSRYVDVGPAMGPRDSLKPDRRDLT